LRPPSSTLPVTLSAAKGPVALGGPTPRLATSHGQGPSPVMAPGVRGPLDRGSPPRAPVETAPLATGRRVGGWSEAGCMTDEASEGVGWRLCLSLGLTSAVLPHRTARSAMGPLVVPSSLRSSGPRYPIATRASGDPLAPQRWAAHPRGGLFSPSHPRASRPSPAHRLVCAGLLHTRTVRIVESGTLD
jgi:hypothetical protein